MLPSQQIEIVEYLDARSRSPFAEWFDNLNAPAAAKVSVALTRLGMGNFSRVQGVGAGLFEYKIDFGPGYRVYFGKDGERIVVLLGGGAKKRQQQDISDAIARWFDYKRRKQAGGSYGPH